MSFFGWIFQVNVVHDVRIWHYVEEELRSLFFFVWIWYIMSTRWKFLSLCEYRLHDWQISLQNCHGGGLNLQNLRQIQQHCVLEMFICKYYGINRDFYSEMKYFIDKGRNKAEERTTFWHQGIWNHRFIDISVAWKIYYDEKVCIVVLIKNMKNK